MRTIKGECPNCEKELEIDIFGDEAFVILPIFKECECGEKYCIMGSIYDNDNIEIDFYEYKEN